jgi:hyperosmotically inducible periplasmic protein
MQLRPTSLAISLTLVTGAVLLVTGCNRAPETTPPAAAVTATTVGTEIDDTVVTTKVKAALLGDPDTKSFDIKVETRKGVVQLSGFVDNHTQAGRAKSIAQTIEGVKSIDDAMTVKEGEASIGNAVDDGMVTTNVKSALLADPDTKSFEIAVATHKGEVQLSGFLASQAQIDHVVKVTKNVAGVASVINELTVKK